ncbi:hypothetical protein MTO96_033272 [Rhipicephalus appendiculatus]
MFAYVKYEDKYRAILPFNLVKTFSPKSEDDFDRTKKFQAFRRSDDGEIQDYYPAFVYALAVDSVALVWEKYFESRVLRHAYRPVAAHQLLYKRLLSRMPDSAAEAILVVGSGHCVVPSATHPSFNYEVFMDNGLCTCSFGKQGAFCKHQALVQKTYRGLFPNAPALSTNDRYRLGQLALGDECKKKWEYLRDKFTKEARSQATGANPAKRPRTDDGHQASSHETPRSRKKRGESSSSRPAEMVLAMCASKLVRRTPPPPACPLAHVRDLKSC